MSEIDNLYAKFGIAVVAPHLTVDRLEPMIEIIGWNEKCVQNALKL